MALPGWGFVAGYEVGWWVWGFRGRLGHVHRTAPYATMREVRSMFGGGSGLGPWFAASGGGEETGLLSLEGTFQG